MLLPVAGTEEGKIASSEAEGRALGSQFVVVSQSALVLPVQFTVAPESDATPAVHAVIAASTLARRGEIRVADDVIRIGRFGFMSGMGGYVGWIGSAAAPEPARAEERECRAQKDSGCRRFGHCH